MAELTVDDAPELLFSVNSSVAERGGHLLLEEDPELVAAAMQAMLTLATAEQRSLLTGQREAQDSAIDAAALALGASATERLNDLSPAQQAAIRKFYERASALGMAELEQELQETRRQRGAQRREGSR